MKLYIVENSELQIQLQKQEAQYKKDLENLKEENSVGVKVLQEEYQKRLQEIGQFKETVQQLRDDKERSTVEMNELHEVIADQKQTINGLNDV